MVHVNKKNNESNESLVRRFVKKVQASGNLFQAKKKQYHQPKLNKRKTREKAQRKAEITAEKEFLKKIGKLEEKTFSRKK